MRKIILSLALSVISLCFISAEPKSSIITSDKAVKTLESNSKTDVIVINLNINNIQFLENDNVSLNTLSSTKFSLVSGIEKDYFTERLNFTNREKYNVSFVLISKKPKIYQITNIEGLETVAEYTTRINECTANEKAGFGFITNAIADNQRTENEKAGYGKITDTEVTTQRTKNEAANLGKITDFELAKERAENSAAGLGNISHFQVKTEKESNSKQGLGNITNKQVEIQKEANKKANFGEFTDFQLSEQKDKNKKAGYGDITDSEVVSQKDKNNKAGYGDITDFQADEERKANSKAGEGKITNAELAIINKQVEDALAEGKKLENESKLIEAMVYYLNCVDKYTGTKTAVKSQEAYNKISEAIKNGKPGLEKKYSAMELYEGWINLVTEYENYWASHSTYNIFSRGFTRLELNAKTKTGTYTPNFVFVPRDDFLSIRDSVLTGYREAYKSSWSDLPKDWLTIGKVKYYDPDIRYYYTFEGFISYQNKDYQYVIDKSRYTLEYVVQDKNGKNLFGKKSFTFIPDDYNPIENISSAVMKQIDNYEASIVITKCSYSGYDYNISLDIKDLGTLKTPVMIDIPGKNFKMSKYEITQDIFYYVMGYLPYEFRNKYSSEIPMSDITWVEALIFCNKLSIMTGKSPVYSLDGSTNPEEWENTEDEPDFEMNTSADGYRLPTIEEWTYAEKGGEDFRFAGSNDYNDTAWISENTRYGEQGPHPTGKLKPNGYGLYDMRGNVSEFCWNNLSNTPKDWYEKTKNEVYAYGSDYNTREYKESGVQEYKIVYINHPYSDTGFRVIMNK